MDIPDEVESAPPSETETTHRTKPVKVDFRGHSLTFCDSPALSSMNPDRQADLNNWLWGMDANRARGDASWRCFANPPDAVIVVVSLMSWRDERDALKDYLKELQATLRHKHKTNSKAVFCFVVVLTHQDMFLEEEGNQGRDPLAQLEEAERQIKSMANTDSVFTLSNYKEDWWWQPLVTESTYRMLRAITHLASERTHTAAESRWARGALLLVSAVCVGLAAVACGPRLASAGALTRDALKHLLR